MSEKLIVINAAIDDLVESPFNPRRHLPNLEEMTASIASLGIIEPLIVRIVDGHYEIVDGHRRFAAAQDLGLKSVSCIVKTLDDQAAQEIQLVTALQREELHPYAEALAIAELLRKSSGDYKGVAAKLGKSIQYVKQREVLKNLSSEAVGLFATDMIDLEAAYLLARMQPADQEMCLKRVSIPGEHIKTWAIQRYSDELLRELADVPWKLSDETLLPQAGACSLCPKQTGAEPMLFGEVKKSSCTDSVCFAAKRQAYIERMKEKKPDIVLVNQRYGGYGVRGPGELSYDEWREIEPGKKTCEDTHPALLVDSKKWKQIQVCTNPKKCKTHGMTSTGKSLAPEAKAERKEQLQKIKDNTAAGLALFHAIMQRSDKLLLGRKVIAQFVWSRMWHDLRKDYFKGFPDLQPLDTLTGKDYSTPVERMIDKGSMVDADTLTLSFAISPLLSKFVNDDEMKDLAKTFGVDLAALRRDLKKKKPESKPSVEPKKKSSRKKRPRNKRKADM